MLFTFSIEEVLRLNNWIATIFNTRRGINLLQMFGRRRNNNRRMMWASLLGIGASAAAYRIGRNRNTNMMRPVRNVMNNLRTNGGQVPKMANAMEFAEEFVPNKKPFKNE
jgi:hypothetical protein